MYTVTPFDTKHLDQLDRLPPETWQSNAYDLFMHNEWQPWFHPFQIMEKDKLLSFGMLFHFDDVAWLGWILVHHRYRNQGIGTLMSQHLIDYAHKLGASKLVLTATDLGAPIYEKLGFKTTSYYHFMASPQEVKIKYDKMLIRRAKPSDLKEISEIDFLATGENRKDLLENHLDATFVYVTPKVEAFYIENIGTGFIAARNYDTGIQLSHFRNRKRDQMIIVPDGNTVFLNELQEAGFIEKYKIPRMTLGEEPNWKPQMIFNRGAGYCG